MRLTLCESHPAPQKEQRKNAIKKLLEISNDDNVASFLQRLCLDDKAKTLRQWLKAKITDTFKKKEEFRAILERSLFEGGSDLNEDVSQYVKLMGISYESVETLCQACSTNPRAIKQTSRELGHHNSFKRFLINNLSLSTSREAWLESATAGAIF